MRLSSLPVVPRDFRDMKPEVVELTVIAMDSLRERVKANQLNEADRQLVDQIMGSYVHLSALLAEKNITISRLRSLIFGSQSETAKDLFPSNTSETGQGQEEEPKIADGPESQNQSHGKSEDPSSLDPPSAPPAT
jgi:transposase